MNNEIKTTATGGRSLGRADITASQEQEPVTFYRTDDTPTIFAGFRQEWLSGSDEDGTTFGLAAGAGLGSPYLTLDVTLPDGREIHEYVDIREVVRARVERIVADAIGTVATPDGSQS